MKLIKLHTSDDEDAVYINPEHIVSIWKFHEGSIVKTVKDINSDSGFCVKESPDQIIEAIHDAPRIDTSRFKIERICEEDYKEQ